MKKAVNAVFFCIFCNVQAKRRKALSERLHRIFYMDAIDGSLDVATRSYFVNR